MFGNYFFLLFYIFKNNFLVLRQKKTCLATQNRLKTKTVLKTQFVKEIENRH